MIDWFEKHNKISWAITILIAILIFYLSSIKFYSSGPGLGGNIKSILYHIIIFFLFASFILVSLVKGKNKQLIALGILISLTYGILDELHQYFVSGRTATVSDVMLDTVGILFAFIIYSISLVYRSNFTKEPSIVYTN